MPLRIVCAVLVGLGWAVAPAAAQQGDRPRAAAQEAGTPALEVLLESREALALTPEQLEAIEAIRLRLAERNRPLVTRMLELRLAWRDEQNRLALEQRRAGRGGRAVPAPNAAQRLQSAGLQRVRRAAQPLNQQIQANNQAAMREVSRVLTPEQRQRLRALVEARRSPPPGGGNAAPRGGGGVGL